MIALHFIDVPLKKEDFSIQLHSPLTRTYTSCLLNFQGILTSQGFLKEFLDVENDLVIQILIF